jgi:hypothetical protein
MTWDMDGLWSGPDYPNPGRIVRSAWERLFAEYDLHGVHAAHATWRPLSLGQTRRRHRRRSRKANAEVQG